MTYKGIGCIWGTSGASAASGSVTISGSFTTVDYSEKVSEAEVANGDGEVIGHGMYKKEQEATFEHVIIGGAANATNITGALVGAGDTLTVTNGSLGKFAGTWPIVDSGVKLVNTNAAIQTFKLHRFTTVTYS